MNKGSPHKENLQIPRKDLEAILGALNGKNDEIKKKVYSLLEMSDKDIEKYKKEQKFQECISNKSKFHMLQENYFSEKNEENYKILKTLISIGLNLDEFRLEDLGKTERSYNNFATNYKSWLGEKLHLTKEEIVKITIDEIDHKVNKYLSMAIDHVNRFIDMIPYELQGQFKSEYFESIHSSGSEQKTILDLLVSYLRLERDKIAVYKKNIDADILRNHSIAQFEIQRLLALAVLYRDREQNHEFQHFSEDESFIKNKLREIFSDKGHAMGTNPLKGLKSESGLYDYTITKRVYVTKKTDGKYEIADEIPKKGEYMIVNLNGTEIEGFTDYYKTNKSKVKIEHIGLRTTKDPASAVNKLVGKYYSSFTEILDQKGIIIVLDRFADSDTLEKIIANELGTKETSWVEKLEYVDKHNHNSSNAYKVKKGILKMSYKAKDRKLRMQSLKKDIQELEAQVKKMPSEQKENTELISRMKKDIEYLKNRLKNLSYNLEVEIQIFDLQSYIRAEIDKDSPAYHGAYKKYQRIFDLFPKYFPEKVYGEENLRKVIMPIIDEKYKKEGVI